MRMLFQNIPVFDKMRRLVISLAKSLENEIKTVTYIKNSGSEQRFSIQ